MERMSSIELALKNEKTEMEFYQHEARRSRNPLARAMFENLAADEREHLNRIGRLHKRLLSDGAWPEDVTITVAGTDVRKTLQALVSREGSATDHDDDDLKALDRAIGFETRGSTFYAELARACSNPAERTFFEFLSRIEREHQLSVTDSLAYLKDPKGWMLQHERAGLDGA